jgi:hypothetical protein
MIPAQLTFAKMSELTKEYLDKAVANLATKQDLTTAVAPLATKDQIEELARMTKHGFDDVLERLDVRERMSVVERKLQKIGEALHINL